MSSTSHDLRSWGRRIGDQRCIALALVLICLAGQLTTFSHLLLVRHATCVEHGEIIHPDESRRGCPNTGGFAPGSEAEGELHQASTAAEAAKGHGHCFLLSDCRARVTLERLPSSLRIDPPTLAKFGYPEDSAPESSLPLYLLAPKNSPPA